MTRRRSGYPPGSPGRAPAFAWTRRALEARDGIGNGAELASFEAVQRPVVRPSTSTAVVTRSGTADDGRRQMAQSGSWGRFVDTQMLRTIIGFAAGVILTLSGVVAVSHRLLESDLTGKLNTSRPSSML